MLLIQAFCHRSHFTRFAASTFFYIRDIFNFLLFRVNNGLANKLIYRYKYHRIHTHNLTLIRYQPVWQCHCVSVRCSACTMENSLCLIHPHYIASFHPHITSLSRFLFLRCWIHRPNRSFSEEESSLSLFFFRIIFMHRLIHWIRLVSQSVQTCRYNNISK